MLNKYKKQRVLDAIKGSNGIILNVANNLDCDWHTAKTYIEKWDETIKALEDENEVGLDFTESKMFDRISDGSDTMIKFHLSTKGKNRGYVERKELDNNVIINFEDIEDYLDNEDHET